MKHLYIIGNGFDIFTGLQTSYSNFRDWLKCHFAFVYEEFVRAFDADGEWWCNFEMNLGKIDIEKYVEKYHEPSPKSIYESKCANRIESLLDILQYCFEKWVIEVQNSIESPSLLGLETEDSFFINFNYTDVLESIDHIPEDRVLHIHGLASTHEHLVFGHNRSMLYDKTNHDASKVGEVLDRYNKNPYYYLNARNVDPKAFEDVGHIHVYGLSFSPVDVDYFDWIYRHTSASCDWEVSSFTNKDEDRIRDFANECPGLAERLRFVRLDEMVLGDAV